MKTGIFNDYKYIFWCCILAYCSVQIILKFRLMSGRFLTSRLIFLAVHEHHRHVIYWHVNNRTATGAIEPADIIFFPLLLLHYNCIRLEPERALLTHWISQTAFHTGVMSGYIWAKEKLSTQQKSSLRGTGRE